MRSFTYERALSPAEAAAAAAKKKLSYAEAREFAAIEARIAHAEREMNARRAALENPEVVGDHLAFRDTCAQFEEAQKLVDYLYARWAELEQKKG